MRNHIFKTGFGVIVALFLFGGGTTAATYRVTIDCSHPAVRNTDTGNRITVSFRDASGLAIRNVSRNGIRNCAQTDPVFSIDTNRVVRYVTFSTNGNDAFFIDRWSLFRDNQRVYLGESDAGKGWCLSTDPRDAAGAWSNFLIGGCRSSIRFPVGDVSGPPVGNSYRLQIDCNHGAIRNEDTGNRISVAFLDSNGNTIRRVSKNAVRNCAQTDTVFAMNSNREVRHVEFSTDGNDAFFIDEWRLYKGSQLVRHEGRDDGKGWCLSTDPSDAAGVWQNYLTGGCRSRVRFPIDGEPPPGGNDYKFQIDCSHGSIRDEDTENQITVTFLDANRNVIRRVSKNRVRNCARTDQVFAMSSNREVQFVEISTNGNDAFYIDEWRLYKGGRLVRQEGRDNGKGWCLSTDPRDAAGAWRNYVTGGCRSTIRFPLAGGTDVSEVVNYRVTVDCHHSAIRDTDTGDRITVSFLGPGRNVIRSVSKTGIRNCLRNEAGFSINTRETVRYIEFKTNGSDAFYIDEWRLLRDGRSIKRQGTDNGRGWCLSTDTRDGAGAWRNYLTGGCRARIRFPV